MFTGRNDRMNNYAFFFLQFQVYKRKNETAKKDYLKALAEYRSGQSAQVSSSFGTASDVISVQ